MKKAKIISLIVIMLSVVALGVFMGKQIFKLLEAGSVPVTPAQTASQAGDDSSVKILYSSEKTNENEPEPVLTQIAEEKTSIQTINESPNKQVAAPATGPVFDPDGAKWFAYASGNGINVREGSSTKDKLLFKVAKGTRGSVIARKNGWTNIKWDFNRKTGWVRDDLLIQGPADILHALVQKTEDIGNIDANKIGKAEAKAILKESKVAVAIAKSTPVSETVSTIVDKENMPQQAKIDATTFANIRSAPGTGHERIARLPKGMVVKIKDVRREGRWQWFEIIFSDGKKTGWTREDNLKF